jgi:hypothetical protein
LQNVGKK